MATDRPSVYYFCCSPRCPGYPYRASEIAHPVETCGALPLQRCPRCGNTGTHGEGGHDYCSTCGMVLRVRGIGYPPGWPACPGCGEPALDGHVTCGRVECAEHRRH